MAQGKLRTFDGGPARTNGHHPIRLFPITPLDVRRGGKATDGTTTQFETVLPDTDDDFSGFRGI